MSCVVVMTGAMAAMAPAAAQTQGPPAPPPPRDAESAAARAKEMVDPIKRCRPADDGSINVCGSDTDLHRLTPELRAIANEGREAPPKLPRAEAQMMMWDRLPHNWMSLGGRAKPGPEYNEQFEAMKRATDPETGTPPTPEEEP